MRRETTAQRNCPNKGIAAAKYHQSARFYRYRSVTSLREKRMDAPTWTFETRAEFLIYLVHRDVSAYANHESDKAIGTPTCAINSQRDRCPAQRGIVANIAECYLTSLRTPCKLNASTSNRTCRERARVFVNDTVTCSIGPSIFPTIALHAYTRSLPICLTVF